MSPIAQLIAERNAYRSLALELAARLRQQAAEQPAGPTLCTGCFYPLAACLCDRIQILHGTPQEIDEREALSALLWPAIMLRARAIWSRFLWKKKALPPRGDFGS